MSDPLDRLTDAAHPCQALADVFTVREPLSRIERTRVAYLRDGNNVCSSLMVAVTRLGGSFVTSMGLHAQQALMALVVR